MVVDRFVSPDESSHKYTVSYQLDTQPYEVSGNTFKSDFGDGVTMSVIGSVPANVVIAQREPLYLGWRPACFNAQSYDFEHLHAPALQFSVNGVKKRVVNIIYPSNNGEVAIKDVYVSDDFNDTKITLEFADGTKVTLDENDYPCTHSENIYFK
jgi:hypothetical protein